MKIQTLKGSVLVLVVVTLLAFANESVNSQTSTPDSLVRALYQTHDDDLKRNKDSFLNGKSRKTLDKYFDKRLANYIWKDLTTHKGEVGVLDFDPFYNTQDPQITDLIVGPAKIVATTALIRVTFKNAGRKDTITYKLTRQKSVWKIADIEYDKDQSLLRYFKEDANNK